MKKTLILAIILAALAAAAQSPSTTTVQGTVYNAAGAPISGTLQLTWPAFTTSANQAIAAGRLTVAIATDGFLSVNLAPNMGATPAGLYYTAVYHLADGTTSTEYWVVPAAPQATLAAVRAQVMPAAQAVQAVNKAYVDQAIQQYATNQVSTFGGTLSGPLYLNGDPLIPTQAANKHYVDNQFAQSLPSAGGIATGPLTATQLGGVYQADQASGSDFTTKLQACINGLNSTYGGTCDARNFTGSLTMSAPLTIATANVTVQFPCATIATAYPIVVAPGTRNVTLHGCATRGTSSASGSQGGTVFLFSGSAALFQIGDSTYAADTSGFHLDNVAINTTASTSATAQALAAWRTQELQLTSLYLLGNSNQTALTLDGTGNYTGGTFSDIQIGGYLTAVNAIGHQVANPAATDWLNASTFVRLHIDCPTSSGNPIAGTTGINLQQGDGNTITGGDIEGCGTALHLGANAQNNTILGLRNENSTYQVMADPGSSYNNWITGGTMFTGRLSDNGTRNSFLDTFHRSFNALNGDWYGSQQDSTVTNHFRLGIGSGNERGLLNRYQSDSGYRWTTGLSDAAAGEQFYQVLDELNNVYRLSIGQYNNGQSSTNNQTVLNSAGSGAVVLNGSNNAGTGGVVIGSGGVTSSTVATIDKSGNANFTGALQVGGTSQSTGPITIRNNADAEVDYYLWPGLTSSQKGSFVYKDYNGNSQWYLVKDQNNNWAINSAIGGLDSFKAYQSNNSGDTYVNASNSSGAVRVNYESGSGAAFNIYGGNASTLYAGFTGPAAIKFPGLAASTGHNCMQIDNSGWITNTGSNCGTGTVGAGTAGQVAWYSASGTAVTGMAAVPLSAGGTGASSAPTALANLGAVPASGGVMTGPLAGTTASFSGPVAAGASLPSDITSGMWGISSQGKLNGAAFLTAPAGGICAANDAPCLATQAACSTGGLLTVYFPYLYSKSGVYSTAGVPAMCSNLTIECARGVTFAVTGPDWGLYNPGADLTSGVNGVNNLKFEGCTWDLTNNPAAQGGWKIKGIGFSNFYANSISTNNNSQPAVTEDADNWQFNGGDYDNNFYSTKLFNYAQGVNAVPYTGAGWKLVNGSNENHHYGGSASRFNPPFDIENGNHNLFSGIDAENYSQTGIILGSAAADNKFEMIRLESDWSPWTSGAKAIGTSIVDSNGNLQTVTTAGATGVSAPSWSAGNVNAILDSFGCSILGTAGQTVLLTAFNNGSAATATGTLVRANTLTGATWVITNQGTGATAAPTSAACSAGGANPVTSASGVATITTSVGTVGNTTTDGNVKWTLTQVLPADVWASPTSVNNSIDAYFSGYETGVVDLSGQNQYPRPTRYGSPARGNHKSIVVDSVSGQLLFRGINKIPRLADGYSYGGLDVHGEIQTDRQFNLCAYGQSCEYGYSMLQSQATGAQTVKLPAGGTGAITLASNAPATSSSLGLVQPDNATVGVNGSGVLSVLSNSPVIAHATGIYSNTASSPFTSLYTTTQSGLYQVCGFLSSTAAGTTASGTVNWSIYMNLKTDGTVIAPSIGLTVSNTAAPGTINATQYNNNCVSYYVDSGSNIQWSVNLGGGGTASTGATLRYSISLAYLNP